MQRPWSSTGLAAIQVKSRETAAIAHAALVFTLRIRGSVRNCHQRANLGRRGHAPALGMSASRSTWVWRWRRNSKLALIKTRLPPASRAFVGDREWNDGAQESPNADMHGCPFAKGQPCMVA